MSDVVHISSTINVVDASSYTLKFKPREGVILNEEWAFDAYYIKNAKTEDRIETGCYIHKCQKRGDWFNNRWVPVFLEMREGKLLCTFCELTVPDDIRMLVKLYLLSFLF